MVQASDITIGALLKTNKGEVIRVDSISTKHQHRKVGYHKDGDMCHINYVRLSQCEGIPLTDEIFKANGFRVSHSDLLTTLYTLDETPLQFEIGNRTSFYGYWYSGYKISTPHYTVFSVCYIHELQNVLRLCGLLEKADNIKV